MKKKEREEKTEISLSPFAVNCLLSGYSYQILVQEIIDLLPSLRCLLYELTA